MPISSLPGDGPIGDLGKPCFDFIDRLSELGAAYWQILPLNILDIHGCPYASPSAFGGEPLLLDGTAFFLSGDKTENHDPVDYEKLHETKGKALIEFAKDKIKEAETQAKIVKFTDQNFWVEDLAVFLTLREAYGDHWTNWPEGLQDIQVARKKVLESYGEDFQIHLWLQLTFHEQWKKVLDYAEAKNIQIIGDIPIFVAQESFDSWKAPELFKIDPETFQPYIVTGAPPDEFNDKGQTWGTLNYHWDKEDLHDWWLKRLEYSNKMYHLTRIDHFVGFYHVWEVGINSEDAKLGSYVPSHGRVLLEKIQNHFPNMPFIAEDLGVLTEGIKKLRDDFNFPSMRVYQFSLEEEGKPETKVNVNEHYPENVPVHSFYYSGTHDNNTLKGWYEEHLLNEGSDKAQQL
ncbi:MAG: 4-alpha-glucanotransferase, partial [Halobacteriovoraceae bacterium]|nr:4-alpha-glucanotransferase [Halobacteriovoraceae bacterium]